MYTKKLRSGTQKLKTRRSMQTQKLVAREERDIVIVGGGICGLATALALHRKGIKSVVLERSETLRSTGAAIIMQPNGWRALDQLGVASKLRQTAVPILSGLHIAIESNELKELPDVGKEELRCLKRADLIQSLADDLPADTIRFKCQVISAKLDPITSFPILQLHDGTLLKAEVVIGCDGVNSIISASILGLKSAKHFSTCVIRGFTNYEDGHEFGNKFVVVSGKDQVQLGRMSITNKLVYWFLTRKWSARDGMISKHPELIKRSVTETMTDRHFPKEAVEMTSKSELDSLHVTEQLRYRPPLELLRRRFRKGPVTVAGDAMHAMGPFLAQGGSASLEDAVVLGRCLARNLRTQYSTSSFGGREMRALMVGNAFDEYVKERRMRAFRVSMETYLIGLMLDSSSVIVKFIAIALMRVVFRDPAGHTRYNCGRL